MKILNIILGGVYGICIAVGLMGLHSPDPIHRALSPYFLGFGFGGLGAHIGRGIGDD